MSKKSEVKAKKTYKNFKLSPLNIKGQMIMVFLVSTILCCLTTVSHTANTTTTVTLKTGATIAGEIIDITPDSLVLDTKHGEILLQIRDIDAKSWEEINSNTPKQETTNKIQIPKQPARKKLVSELLADNTPSETLPETPYITINQVQYELRKVFESSDKAEFIYSPTEQPDFKMAKDNLRIWAIKPSNQSDTSKLTDNFLERFGEEGKRFKKETSKDNETVFHGPLSRKKDSDPKYIIGKTSTNNGTSWVVVHAHSNSENELNGWKTDNLENFKQEMANFKQWPTELLIKNN